MGAAYQKGMLLFHQRRWRAAAEQFQLELADNPRSAVTLSMLALSLVNDQRLEDAYNAASEAILVGPEHAQGYWAMANVVVRRKRPRRWLQYSPTLQRRDLRRRLEGGKMFVREAIRLYPFEPTFYEMLSAIEADLHHWQASLDAAESGLQVNPQHLGCANRRAMLLHTLGRSGEARAEIDRAIGINPEHALTHRNRGWVLLQAGLVDEAREHFESSLRLNPTDTRAQAGLREARRARVAPYRWMLRFFLWANRPMNRWLLITFAVIAGLLSGVNEDRVHMHRPWNVAAALAESAAVTAVAFALVAAVRRMRARWRGRASRLGPAQAVEGP